MNFRQISIRGRMAYLLCIFENLLIYFKCDKEDWRWILEKLWQYTNIEYLDDWMYEIAEYMPESVIEDNTDGIEYITENELAKLKNLYSNNPIEINKMLRIIFELGTIDLYSKLEDGSPETLAKLQEGIDIAMKMEIHLPNKAEFERYSYTMGNGWGIPFDGKEFSLYL